MIFCEATAITKFNSLIAGIIAYPEGSLALTSDHTLGIYLGRK